MRRKSHVRFGGRRREDHRPIRPAPAPRCRPCVVRQPYLAFSAVRQSRVRRSPKPTHRLAAPKPIDDDRSVGQSRDRPDPTEDRFPGRAQGRIGECEAAGRLIHAVLTLQWTSPVSWSQVVVVVVAVRNRRLCTVFSRPAGGAGAGPSGPFDPGCRGVAGGVAAGEGWLYLAAVQDLFSRRIVGWAMEAHMRCELVVAAPTHDRQPRDGRAAALSDALDGFLSPATPSSAWTIEPQPFLR
jgi:transposase InsO family protein